MTGWSQTDPGSGRPGSSAALALGLSVLLGWAATAPLHAALGFWSSLGPVVTFAIAPGAPSTLYAAGGLQHT